MTLSPELLEILVCPKCKGELEHTTAVEDDIPIMLIDEATPL